MHACHDHPSGDGALGQFIVGVDSDFSLPAAERPHAVHRRLRAALDSPELFLDCAQLLLSQLLHQPDAQVLFSDPHSRYTLQVFCWPPGFGNEPHLHRNWTVSGMMANSLLVFRSGVSMADCLGSQPLHITAGQAGILIPPQFHCLRNAGTESAITFHVFSADEARHDGAHQERPPTSASRFDHEDILAIARAATLYGGTRAVEILRAAFTVSDHATKLSLVKLMCGLDPVEAVRIGRILADQIGGRDGQRLFAVLEKLEADAALEV